jgi:hypothetical protein
MAGQADWQVALGQWKGATDATTAAQTSAQGAVHDPNALDAGPIGGFLASAGSSIPEMFGQHPTDAANQFRNEHPIAGVVSELLPTLIPYAGIETAVAKIPRLAEAVETGTAALGRGFGLAKTGITAETNPVLWNAAKEVVKFSPFELGRLGIGMATTPEDDWGHLFADVGLSTALAGGFGGIGGFFKAGGKLLPKEGRVVGADAGLAPTFERRMADTPDASVTGDYSLDDVKAGLDQKVLTETPGSNVPNGMKARYVNALDGGSPETDGLVNMLFKADNTTGQVSGLDRRLLAEGTEDSKKTLDFGQQSQVLSGLGFSDVGDLTSNVRYPRLVTVTNDRAAGTLAKSLDEATGLQAAGDGVLLGRQADDGLWVVAKRLKAGAADDAAAVPEGELPLPAGAPKQYGQQGIAKGDQWFVGLTDKPQRFLPAEHSAIESTVSSWAKMREAYQPGRRDDLFNKAMDGILQGMTPGDPAAMQRLGRKSWVTSTADRLLKAGGEMTGLTGSQTAHDTANFLFDVMAPTMFKEAKSPVFGRLFGLLRGTQLLADAQVGRIIKGVQKTQGNLYKSIGGAGVTFESAFKGHTPISQLWADLLEKDPEGFQKVVKAGLSATPAEDLAKLTADGHISQLATDTYKQLQAVNKSAWEDLLPVFKNTDLESKFKLLDGYILPRVFKGDWYTQVVDEAGKPAWLATGSRLSSQKEAQAVIDEAASRGLKWRLGDEYAKGARNAAEIDDVQAIHQMVDDRIGKGADVKDVVEAALRKVDAGRQSRGGLGSGAAPRALTTERTGIRGSADNHVYTLNDVVSQSQSHYSRLYRFAGQYAWRNRWMQEAYNFGKTDKTLFDDLKRKADQYLGREGEITQVMNKTLEPVLGKTLGGKAATRIAQGTNKLLYNWTFAIGNPIGALMNVLQPLQTLAPAIAYMTHAPAEEVKAWYHFVPAIGADGKFVGVAGHLNPMKVLGSATMALRDPHPELRTVIERATSDGTLQHARTDEWLGAHSAAATTLRETFQHQGGWEGIKRVATYMTEKSEQYSRMVSAAALWQVGKGHFGLEGEQLYRFVQRGVHVTNYGYNVVDRSRMFTGPVGSMFGLLKNWQVNFIGQMMQYAGVGMREGVWSPLMWQGASALALGGLGATPLVALADGLARWNSDSKSSFEWLHKNWNGAADDIYYGLPAFLGASLQASSSIPGTDVRNDAGNLMSFSFIEKAKQVGKALGTTWELGTTGDVNALRNPAVRDQLLNAMAPRALFRAVSAMEGDYIRSMATGAPTVRGLSTTQQMLHGFGINLLDVEREQHAAKELYDDQEATKAAVQSMGKLYSDAILSRDSDEMQRIVGRSIAMGLPMTSVMSSAMTLNRRELSGDALSRFKGQKVAEYRQMLSE